LKLSRNFTIEPSLGVGLVAV